MALILAIEPDGRQAAHLTSLVRDRLHADLVLADTTEGALMKIGNRVPDLVLVPSLLSPQEDAALAGALRAIAEAARVQMLTIPMFADAAPRPKRTGMLSKLRRGRNEAASTDGCDPAVFGDQIAAYLAEGDAARALAADKLRRAMEAIERPADQPIEQDATTTYTYVEQFVEPMGASVDVAPPQEVFEPYQPPRTEPAVDPYVEPAVVPVVQPVTATEDESIDIGVFEPMAEVAEATVVDYVLARAPVGAVLDEPVLDEAVLETSDLVEPVRVEHLLVEAVASEAFFEEPVREEQVVQAAPEPEPVSEEFIPEPVFAEGRSVLEPIPEPVAVEPVFLEPVVEPVVATPLHEPVYEPPEPAWPPAKPVSAEPVVEEPGEPLREEPVSPASPSWLDRVMRDILDRFGSDQDDTPATPINEAPVYEISLEELRRETRPATIEAVATTTPTIDERVERDPMSAQEPELTPVAPEPEAVAPFAEPAAAFPMVEPVVVASAPNARLSEPQPPEVAALDEEVIADFVNALEPLIGEQFVGTPAIEGVFSGEELTQSELDRLFLMKAGVRLPVEENIAPPPRPAPPAPASQPPAAATASKTEKPEWVALIESLRSDIERLKGERTPGPTLSPREQNRARRQAQRSAVRRAPMRKPEPKSKPIQDQWGLFDPDQCGFAALRAKLDEITESNDEASA